MGVLLQGFFSDVTTVEGSSWWDHLARQARDFAVSGFTAIWLPPPLKGNSGGFSDGYDPFDDYDLGSKNQKGTIPTRYGSRQQLQRCAAMMRANGIDIYADLVDNQRDGDDGFFNFRYADAFGNVGANPLGGRFSKSAIDFFPNVPLDPGVFTAAFSDGRKLAPINGGTPRGQCGLELTASADWLTRALDIQGYRVDNAEGVSTVFVTELLRAKSMANKFAVGEFANFDIQNLMNWSNPVQHRASAFDFPLHQVLQQMCDNPGFAMSSLDHAGLAGVDPLGAVTFVDNHDTDAGKIGGPVVRNKLLAYAYILTSEGYPSVFYRDYSTDPNCFGLKDKIDRLIWIHEKVAAGDTLQRWKENGVFAFERLGGSHLLVGLNTDEGAARTITVQTGFPPNRELQNLADDGAPRIGTNGQSMVTITIPKNAGGSGYVCYGLPAQIEAFKPRSQPATQDYEGAADLDIKPAIAGESVQVCQVFPVAKSQMHIQLRTDTANWTPATSIKVTVNGPAGTAIGSHVFDRAAVGSAFEVQPAQTGFHTLMVEAAGTPLQHTPFTLGVTYTAPQTF